LRGRASRVTFIPVVSTLTSDHASTCQLPPATISVFRTSGGAVGSVDESTYLLPADNGANFRISGCQYVYNLVQVRSAPEPT